jgi:glucuronide carrier protein
MTTTRPVEATAAAPPRLGPLQYLGYAAGDAANNLAFSMTSLFLLLRICDGFADIFSVRLGASTMKRWGKFRPFFLFGGPPVLLL